MDWFIERTDEWMNGASLLLAQEHLDTKSYSQLAYLFCLPVDVSCESPYRFRCDNNRCIYKHELCNHVDDCGDGSDEKEEQCKQSENGGKLRAPSHLRFAECTSGISVCLVEAELDLQLQIPFDSCFQTI